MSGRDRDPALAPPALHAPPEALAREAWLLEPPQPHEVRGVDRSEAGLLIDGLLGRVARSRGALDVAIGERLAELDGRTMPLMHSCIGDYARETLGIADGTARAMVRLARGLRERPLLREAVRRGEVSARKAQAVLPAALGEAEPAWVERARHETVRALEAAVRAAGREAPAEDEAWERISVQLAPEDRATVDEAVALAGRILGAGAPRWQRLEAICEEFLGAHPGDETQDGEQEEVFCASDRSWLDEVKEGLEAEMRCWQFLERLEPVAAPAPFGEGGGHVVGNEDREDAIAAGGMGGGAIAGGVSVGTAEGIDGTVMGAGAMVRAADGIDGAAMGRGLTVRAAGGIDRDAMLSAGATVRAAEPIDESGGVPGRGGAPMSLPQLLDSELRGLVAMRDRWDELVGHLGMLLRMLGLHKDMGFASFSHYCAERLGMASRTVEQRIWLERRFYWLPKLRAAMRARRLSYEKARLVAKVADDETSEAWIEKAEKLTCVALRREIERAEETQMCSSGEVGLRVPRRVRILLDAAIRSVRMGSDRWMEPGKCVGIIAQHFIDTWKDAAPRRRSRQQRVLDRDGGFCQAPGCSRRAAHVHHVVFRSAGGGDEETNLLSLCAAHHLHGVHEGWIRVRGEAPHGLRWELGEAVLARARR